MCKGFRPANDLLELAQETSTKSVNIRGDCRLDFSENAVVLDNRRGQDSIERATERRELVSQWYPARR